MVLSVKANKVSDISPPRRWRYLFLAEHTLSRDQRQQSNKTVWARTWENDLARSPRRITNSLGWVAAYGVLLDLW